jgi:hypothetical protein
MEVRVLFWKPSNLQYSRVKYGHGLLSCKLFPCADALRPFKFTPPIPTDESVTHIKGSPLDGLEKQGYIDKTSEAKVHGLLRDIETASCQSATRCKNFDDRRGTGNIGLSPPRLNKPFPEDEGFELVLTKRERRLLAGLSEFEDLQEHHAENTDDRPEQRGVVTGGHDRRINGNGQLLFDEHKYDHSYSAVRLILIHSCLERRIYSSFVD